MPTSENELLDQAVAGNPEALSELIQRHAPQVRQAIQRKIPQRYQAVLSVDDVMQETYTDAFLDVSGFEPRSQGSFTAWLITIAQRNRRDALRMLKAKKRGKDWQRIEPHATEGSLATLWDHLGCSNTTPSRQAARKEVYASLRQAITQLPPTPRTVIEMHDLEGRPAEEIGAALNPRRSPGAVYMIRSRAHRLLARIMGTASKYFSGAG